MSETANSGTVKRLYVNKLCNFTISIETVFDQWNANNIWSSAVAGLQGVIQIANLSLSLRYSSSFLTKVHLHFPDIWYIPTIPAFTKISCFLLLYWLQYTVVIYWFYVYLQNKLNLIQQNKLNIVRHNKLTIVQR